MKQFAQEYTFIHAFKGKNIFFILLCKCDKLHITFFRAIDYNLINDIRFSWDVDICEAYDTLHIVESSATDFWGIHFSLVTNCLIENNSQMKITHDGIFNVQNSVHKKQTSIINTDYGRKIFCVQICSKIWTFL